MTFDLKKFSKTKFGPRTFEFKVPEQIARYFGQGTLTIKNLDGIELFQVREAVKKRNDMHKIVSKAMEGAGQAIAEAIGEMYGPVPALFVSNVETLLLGIIDPEVNRQQATTFCRHYPTQATMIVEQILYLTGEGSLPGELQDSGRTPESDSTATSPTSGESSSLS